jgi:DNA-damage-inducible protein D
MEEKRIALFHGKQIRRTEFRNKWWFVVNDVVTVLTDTPDAKDYIRKMRDRDPELSKGWGQIVTPLTVQTSGGPQKLNCADTEGIFRIIQSIPSPRVEPLKRWLARVGRERIDEIENPEIAMDRMKEIYEKKGYPKGWWIAPERFLFTACTIR